MTPDNPNFSIAYEKNTSLERQRADRIALTYELIQSYPQIGTCTAGLLLDLASVNEESVLANQLILFLNDPLKTKEANNTLQRTEFILRRLSDQGKLTIELDPTQPHSAELLTYQHIFTDSLQQKDAHLAINYARTKTRGRRKVSTLEFEIPDGTSDYIENATKNERETGDYTININTSIGGDTTMLRPDVSSYLLQSLTGIYPTREIAILDDLVIRGSALRSLELLQSADMMKKSQKIFKAYASNNLQGLENLGITVVHPETDFFVARDDYDPRRTECTYYVFGQNLEARMQLMVQVLTDFHRVHIPQQGDLAVYMKRIPQNSVGPLWRDRFLHIGVVEKTQVDQVERRQIMVLSKWGAVDELIRQQQAKGELEKNLTVGNVYRHDAYSVIPNLGIRPVFFRSPDGKPIEPFIK